MFCWHHSDEKRLRKLLIHGWVDCPNVNFLAKHQLRRGNALRISVKVRNEPRGRILVFAELDSDTPFPLQTPLHKDYPFAVNLKSIQILSGAKLCDTYRTSRPPPMNPSHLVEDK